MPRTQFPSQPFPKLCVPLILSMAFVGAISAQSPGSDKPVATDITTPTLREALDTTVSPCDDFEQFANGGWKAKYKERNFGMHHHVKRRMDDRLLAVLEAARKAAPTTTDPTIKVLGTFYASCLAADTVESSLPKTPGGVVPEGRPAQCLASTDRLLSPALSYAFVGTIMTPTVAAYTKEWLGTIQNAMRAQIQQLTWVEDSVKKTLLTAINTMHVGVDLVPPPADYSGLTLSPTDYYGNIKQIPGFEKQRVAKLPKDSIIKPKAVPHHMDSYAAFSLPQFNELYVATVYFLPPFFDVTAEPAANYAALGATLGHEMWHLLTPILKWTSTHEGRLRSTKVVEQYSKFHKSGWGTLNEDLGDIGGLLASHQAWTLYGRKNEKPRIEGFTPEQRFFLYYARMWRNSDLPSEGIHSNPRARINGVVMQMPAFGKAFGCKEGDRMFLAPDRRTDLFQ